MVKLNKVSGDDLVMAAIGLKPDDHKGISKRELFGMMLIQHMVVMDLRLSPKENRANAKHAADVAMIYVDEFIKELNR